MLISCPLLYHDIAFFSFGWPGVWMLVSVLTKKRHHHHLDPKGCPTCFPFQSMLPWLKESPAEPCHAVFISSVRSLESAVLRTSIIANISIHLVLLCTELAHGPLHRRETSALGLLYTMPLNKMLFEPRFVQTSVLVVYVDTHERYLPLNLYVFQLVRPRLQLAARASHNHETHT